MRLLNQLLLTALLNACWQLLLIAAFAALSALLTRAMPARFSHAIWVAALLLSFVLPLTASLRDFVAVNNTKPSVAGTSEERIVQTPLIVGRSQPVVSPPSKNLSRITVGGRVAILLLLSYLMVIAFGVVRLSLAWKRTKSVRRAAQPVEFSARVQNILDHCCQVLGTNSIAVYSSHAVPVPITVGIRKPIIILPAKLMVEPDYDLLISGVGHELVHIKRRDYLFNLVYELIFLPISFHPAASLIRRRIRQTRELCCDEVVAHDLQNAQVYARSLVQLATSTPRLGRLAVTTVGLAESNNLEVRVMSLLNGSKPGSPHKRLLVVAASLLLALPSASVAALALHFEVEQFGPTQGMNNPNDGRLKAIYRPLPEYPEDARAAKIEGTLRLAVTVDPTGVVQDVQVTKPLYPSLDRSAVEAVRHWRFAPFIMNGEPKPRLLITEVVFDTKSWQENEAREAQEREAKKRREIGASTDGDYDTKRQRERLELEARAAAQTELARHARITMDQAIQIATSQYPGTVWECSLEGERWEAPGVLAKDAQVFYHVIVIPPGSPAAGPVHVWVSAGDGRILKTEREERKRQESGNSSSQETAAEALNGRAISLPQPEYPAIARAAHADGTVTTEVTIDESGNVISARDLGPPVTTGRGRQGEPRCKICTHEGCG